MGGEVGFNSWFWGGIPSGVIPLGKGPFPQEGLIGLFLKKGGWAKKVWFGLLFPQNLGKFGGFREFKGKEFDWDLRKAGKEKGAEGTPAFKG